MPKQFLIKNATLIQEGHPRHLKKSDILISDGKISSIAAKLEANAERIEGNSLMVSAGWHDMRAHLSDPGFEHKESLKQLCDAAAAGGFTSISTLPNAYPVVDNKSTLQYVLNSSKTALTSVHPYGAVSEGAKGSDLAELFDMSNHGAVAFTDGDETLSSGLLRKALLYVKSFNGLVISFPMDRSLHHDGQINESEESVHTGLKASPALAEYSCLKQQLDILEYTGGRMHVSGISTKESVELIKQAKKKGLQLSCDVPLYNLCYTDKEVCNFNSNFKLMPLLRSEKDRKALIKGVQDGTIDAISSNHHAQNIELKRVEFDYASNGAISIQTFYSVYRDKLSKDLDEETFIRAIASKPRAILGLETQAIAEGVKANLVVIDKNAKWNFDAKSNKSGSTNGHLYNTEVHGKVVAVFNNNKVNLY